MLKASGKTVLLPQVFVKGTPMIPLSASKQFGVRIVENKKKKTYKTMQGKHWVLFKLNSKNFTVPTFKDELPQPAQLIKKEVYIPLEVFGYVINSKRMVIADSYFESLDSSRWTPEREASQMALKGQKLKPEIYIDRKAVPFKTKPVIKGEIAYFPIKDFSEYIGGQVTEDPKNGTVTIVFHNNELIYTEGIPTVKHRELSGSFDWVRNEFPMPNHEPVKRINGVFMIPHTSLPNMMRMSTVDNLHYGGIDMVVNGHLLFERQVFYTYKSESFSYELDENGNEITDPDLYMSFGNSKATFISIQKESYTTKDKGTQFWTAMAREEKVNGKIRRQEIEFNPTLENGMAVGFLNYKVEIYDKTGSSRIEKEVTSFVKVPLKDGLPNFTWDEAMKALGVAK
ncbi:stalk domain-containing protein [Paenibacillus abyssi]